MKPRIVFFTIFVIGLGLLLYSETKPYWTDTKRKAQLDRDAKQAWDKSECETDTKKKEQLDNEFIQFRVHYYTEVDKLETSKRRFIYVGSGLVIASLTILAFIFTNRIKRFSDFGDVYSLRKRWLFVLANIGWLMTFPFPDWVLTFQERREDFEWFQDDNNAPVVVLASIIILFVGFFVLNIFLFITSALSDFPAKLFARRTKYGIKDILWETMWSILLLLSVFLLINIIITGGGYAHVVISLILSYILLSLRAGEVNYNH